MRSFISPILLATTLLAQSAPRLSRTENLPCALSLARRLEEPSQRADALVEIAKLHLKAEDRATADRLLFESLSYVDLTKRGLFRAGSLGDVLEIGSRDHLARAVEIGKPITGSDGIWALRQLIVAHGRFGLYDQANELLSEGIRRTIARSKKEVWYGDQDFQLAQLLGDAATAGLVKRALRVARGIKNPFVRANVLHPAAIKLAEDKQGRRAVSVARSIHYEIERIDTLVDVANAAITAGDKAMAPAALSYALAETRKDIFDPEQDTKTKALVSISLAYEKLGERTAALTILRRAEKLAYTIEKPGFKDSGLSQVALAYAQYGQFDDALRVTSQIPSPWSDIKSNTLASIGSYLFAAGNRDRAMAVVAQAEQVAKDIDCTYFKYGVSARSCFGNKVSDFLKIASVYEQDQLFDKEVEMLDLAVLHNQYKVKPPHQIIEDGSSVIGDYPVGELDIVKRYLAARQIGKAIEVASKIMNPKDRVVALAIIEFSMDKYDSEPHTLLRSRFNC
jgi:tetratricopeptide (TPR) repeat protein